MAYQGGIGKAQKQTRGQIKPRGSGTRPAIANRDILFATKTAGLGMCLHPPLLESEPFCTSK